LKGERYLDYPDERELDKKDFYREVREGEMPTTAVIPPSRFYEYFEREVKDGNSILYVVFSTGLTTTCQNANIAKDELKEAYPGSDILIVDSKSASLGEGALVYFAAKMRNEGKSKEEIAKWIEENRLHMCHWFTVDDLGHLRRGGRVSATSATVGGVLHIKPIINMSDDGKLEPTEKVRGRKTAIEMLFLKAKNFAIEPEKQTMFIVHADCEDEALWLKEKLTDELGVKEVIVGMMGPVIGTHTGPGAIGFLYFGEKR
jgi:DegV family protein with EDD domain